MMDCIAQVAARATGTSVEAFKVWAAVYLPQPAKSAPYTERHLCAYLIHHGFLCGLRIELDVGERLIPEVPRVFRADFEVAGCPAYVRVESPDPQWNHALYYDGKQLFDPNHDRPVKIGDYRVVSWVPIQQL